MPLTWVLSLGGEDPLRKGNGNPLQDSCWGRLTGRGSWWAAVHGVTEELDMTQQLNNGQQMGVKEQE